MVEQLESALEANIRQYKSWRDAPFCGVCKAGTLGLTRWFLDISGSLCCRVSVIVLSCHFLMDEEEEEPYLSIDDYEIG